jgi:hypothetical protein
MSNLVSAMYFFLFWTAFVALLTAAASAAAPAASVSIKLMDRFAFAAHPAVLSLDHGGILAKSFCCCQILFAMMGKKRPPEGGAVVSKSRQLAI